jgi:hypothetical protein
VLLCAVTVFTTVVVTSLVTVDTLPDPLVELLAIFKIPPATLGGVDDVPATLARASNAARVLLPVVGALMEPTMPDWQWLPVVCAQ